MLWILFSNQLNTKHNCDKKTNSNLKSVRFARSLKLSFKWKLFASVIKTQLNKNVWILKDCISLVLNYAWWLSYKSCKECFRGKTLLLIIMINFIIFLELVSVNSNYSACASVLGKLSEDILQLNSKKVNIESKPARPRKFGLEYPCVFFFFLFALGGFIRVFLLILQVIGTK